MSSICRLRLRLRCRLDDRFCRKIREEVKLGIIPYAFAEPSAPLESYRHPVTSVSCV